MSKSKRITVQQWRANPDQYPDAVYIGRAAPRYGLRASKWANPYRISTTVTRDLAIARYVLDCTQDGIWQFVKRVEELQDKMLVCWCKANERCHGDFLLSVANAETSGRAFGNAIHWRSWAFIIQCLDAPPAESCGIVEETGK